MPSHGDAATEARALDALIGAAPPAVLSSRGDLGKPVDVCDADCDAERLSVWLCDGVCVICGVAVTERVAVGDELAVCD